MVPEPDETDIHNHAFIGRVDSISGRIVTVYDSDGNGFEVELARLTLYEGEK
jgi:hypothetical protein